MHATPRLDPVLFSCNVVLFIRISVRLHFCLLHLKSQRGIDSERTPHLQLQLKRVGRFTYCLCQAKGPRSLCPYVFHRGRFFISLTSSLFLLLQALVTHTVSLPGRPLNAYYSSTCNCNSVCGGWGLTCGIFALAISSRRQPCFGVFC